MKRRGLFLCFSAALALAAPTFCQQPTLARLTHETRADIPRVGEVGSAHTAGAGSALRDSATSRAAADALFVKSNLQRARALSDRALGHDHQDAEALFVRMELAELGADYGTALDAAVRLCATGGSAPGDARVRLAAVRVREIAANTPEFRQAIPQVQALLANSSQPWPDLQLALLKGAMDGAPGLDAYAVARASGILTDWRIVGPIGSRPLLGLEQQPISPAEDLAHDFYANRAVENFQFPDGWLRLPEYLERHGVFYAAGRFASLTSGTWRVSVESAGTLEMFVDGERILRAAATQRQETTSVEVMPGPHRVLLKFVASAAPLRVTVLQESHHERPPLRARISPEEATYLLAAEHYADGEFGPAIKQIDALSPADGPAMLELLRAQSWTLSAPHSQQTATAWSNLLSGFPAALAADETLSRQALRGGQYSEAVNLAARVLAQHPLDDTALQTLTQVAAQSNTAIPFDIQGIWSEYLAEHASCDALQGAMAFYAAQGLGSEQRAAQQKLEGCAPESLAYGESLSRDGNHAEAASALQQLLAGAPLNRAARLMLVGELQLAGEDEAAQRAAAEWLHLAPNAEQYHRLAAASAGTEETAASGAQFYMPYRRDAVAIAHQSASGQWHDPAVVLLDDHVAVSRPDGSVSLYFHTATRLLTSDARAQAALARLPQGAEIITFRILHDDGSATQIDRTAQQSPATSPGDTIDAEYVVNFAGDGGIPEHAEAFQFVFGSFDVPVLSARFVALTAANRAAGGVVIATGEAPPTRTTVRDGMLERVWEKDMPAEENLYSRALQAGQAIVRVVEQDNGWSVPSKAEHQRRIETIHPGPLPEDS